MPFRCRQKLNLGSSKVVNALAERVLESGEYVSELEDLGKKRLPDPELFELKNQIDAGVDMEEVDSKLFSQKVVNADNIVRKYTKKKEVENE